MYSPFEILEVWRPRLNCGHNWLKGKHTEDLLAEVGKQKWLDHSSLDTDFSHTHKYVPTKWSEFSWTFSHKSGRTEKTKKQFAKTLRRFLLPNCRWNLSECRSCCWIRYQNFDVYVIAFYAQLNTSAIKNARNFPETWRWTKRCEQWWWWMNEQRTKDQSRANPQPQMHDTCDGTWARQKQKQ